MSGRGGLTAIKRLMNEFKGTNLVRNGFSYYSNNLEINVNPPEGIFAGIFMFCKDLAANPIFFLLWYLGPISEDNYFVWEAVIAYMHF